MLLLMAPAESPIATEAVRFVLPPAATLEMLPNVIPLPVTELPANATMMSPVVPLETTTVLLRDE